jgi:hypothetical protein
VYRAFHYSSAYNKTEYTLHIYLTGVAAKAFSGACAFQDILNIIKILKIDNMNLQDS